MTELILIPLKKAIASLERALQQPKDEFTRDAVIQRFECTYELSWKMLKKYMAKETGTVEFNIKSLYREAGRQSLIESVENWFAYHAGRDLTSHTYNEATAEETYQIAQQFLTDAQQLLDILEEKCK